MRLAVLGAAGHLGRLVVATALDTDGVTLVAGLGRPGSSSLGTDLGLLCGRAPIGLALTAAGPGAFDGADVVLDVSLPEGLDAALPHLGTAALVTGTTGLDAGQQQRLDAQAQHRPLLQAANFSTGVAVLRQLAVRAAQALPDYDLEIIEAHHRRKRDAPSGTARVLAEDVAHARSLVLDEVARHGREGAVGPRTPEEIGIHAVRAGDIVGEHTLLLAGEGERLTLGHVASSRQCFASGAVRAARWLHGRTAGRYAMADVVA